MSKVLDNIKLYKHQFENGKNFHNIISQHPTRYIRHTCIDFTHRCIKKIPLSVKTCISDDLYKIFTQELKLKTEQLQDYLLENPQNKVSYWGAVFDTLIKFIQSNVSQHHVIWANDKAEKQFSELLNKAQTLIPVILHETPIEKDYDANVGGVLYIREYHGITPASTKYFKHRMVSDQEINAIKTLMEIFDKLPSYFMLQYDTNNIKHAAQSKIATFIKQEDLIKHNMRTFNKQHLRGM